MGNLLKGGASTLWVTVITLGILASLGGVFYTFFMQQQDAGEDGEYRVATNEMRILAQQIAVKSRETSLGEEQTFNELDADLVKFNQLLGSVQGSGLNLPVDKVAQQWGQIDGAARTLVETGPGIVFTHDISEQLEQNVRPIQSEFAAVVDILGEERASATTIAAAQRTLWLTERIARNVDKILAGGESSQAAADEFRSDAANFNRTVDALLKGNKVMGVDQVTDADALASIKSGAGRFTVVSSSIDQIAGAAPQLRQAALARAVITESSPELSDSISALIPALDRLNSARVYDRNTLMAIFGAPALLAVGLLVFMYRNQRQRVVYTEQGVEEINNALLQISKGDLTVAVPETNQVTQEIAKEINVSTARQRELIRNIRTPFEVSVGEISKIGATARGQVDKGKALTRSVVDSTTAATEMVRTSEEIKSSTAIAAKTSERNSERVARGYELTKDMSRASANVREAVQETSKSAKRQGELIQSVTTAAEYIQALNTKISVVAINTRIEAEKAGEHGRPFLGIAEAIGDLLREAEEEGRKVISEVRMLQNMSAENLSSMENTVGTVVTILEYIERLDASLEDINEGSAAITSIITSVDDAAGQSAASAQHMNDSMSDIRERNLEISEYSESTQIGVSALQRSMREVANNLSEFKIEQRNEAAGSALSAEIEELAPATEHVYEEDDMSAMETDDESKEAATV